MKKEINAEEAYNQKMQSHSKGPPKSRPLSSNMAHRQTENTVLYLNYLEDLNAKIQKSSFNHNEKINQKVAQAREHL